MLLLKASNIKKYYGERLVLKLDDFSVYTGHKIGIVGANGAGKSTLLNLLSGRLQPEEGQILSYGTISYASQFREEDGASGTMDGYDPKLLKEMKVSDKTEQDTISGGEETRLKLAGAFGKQGHILLLDEPTANLDITGSRLLQDKLLKVETLLMISHDRALLDVVCTAILEVSQGKLKLYPGNYTEYERLKEAETERDWKEYVTYADEKRRLEEVYLDKKRQAASMTKIPRGMSPREAHLIDFLSNRSHDSKQRNLHQAAKAVKKRMDHLESKEKPREEPKIYLDFALTDPPENKILVEGRDIEFAYGDNVIFNKASFSIPNHTKVAIMGANGTGKTTLLNLIRQADQRKKSVAGNTITRADGTCASSGETGNNDSGSGAVSFTGGIRTVPKAVLGYLYQRLENLDPEQTVIANALKESIQTEVTVRGILARFLFRDNDIYKKVAVLSGGERVKLALAKLLVSDANVLLLDEPTNYLDMPSMIVLQKQIREYEGTIIFVSHDRTFINETADALLIIDNKKLVYYPGSLSQYEEEQAERARKEKKWREPGRNTSNYSPEERMRLELRKAQLLSMFGLKNCNIPKEELEAEYRDVIRKLLE